MSKQLTDELVYIGNNFCGKVIDNIFGIEGIDLNNVIIYLCGNCRDMFDMYKLHPYINNVRVIKELSDVTSGLEIPFQIQTISIGQVPINIHGNGVYFRQFFDTSCNYYQSIAKEHKFQTLTESTKPNNAFRKGIYLTKVNNNNNNGKELGSESELEFNLLRCSSNLSGPTEGLRHSDINIINSINETQKHFFKEKVELNHVLAQIYQNTKTNRFMLFFMSIVNCISTFIFNWAYFPLDPKHTEKKAKIKAHSDKTKDMPRNAIMAFCTFYDQREHSPDQRKSKTDVFDLCYKNQSVLTKLHFKLKPMVTDPKYVKQFTITLYPNSVFLMSLSTNRLYTHEIRPSPLPIDKIPTRMGYVIRCSNTKAVYANGKTYIVDGENKRTELRAIVNEDSDRLKELYFKENTTTEMVSYNDIYFSMNSGDYKKPLI
jgi:hypothetical protein